ncbi:hypothetical protein [Phenylobacterium sp.]|uniref:hypothetical protein n=1 Tax=Phenylobacterium sp. TaxID=1871053 RepID=UPI002735558C|nr:hypothetical protein [Phenylobacterium sp.]MDP3853630.1 hypothetical protein [Phenylobacterium sp.]
MANPATLEVSAAVAASGMIIKITGQRAFAARCWLAVKFFEIGAAVLGMGVEIELMSAADKPAA